MPVNLTPYRFYLLADKGAEKTEIWNTTVNRPVKVGEGVENDRAPLEVLDAAFNDEVLTIVYMSAHDVWAKVIDCHDGRDHDLTATIPGLLEQAVFPSDDPKGEISGSVSNKDLSIILHIKSRRTMVFTFVRDARVARWRRSDGEKPTGK